MMRNLLTNQQRGKLGNHTDTLKLYEEILDRICNRTFKELGTAC